jgi:hypothetical protein
MNEQLRDALRIMIEVQKQMLAELHGQVISTVTATELMNQLRDAETKIV